MKHKLLMYVQKLEKAMHMPERRNSFGHDVATQIKQLLEDKNISSDLRASALSSLERYYLLQTNNQKHIILPDNAFEVLSCISEKRISVRNFSPKEVEIKKVVQAIEVASKLPSACNRQPCEVILIKNPIVKNSILEIHYGNTGFGHAAPLLAVITFDKNAFFQENEDDAGFFHAGLFSAGFILGLESQNINSCALNWHVDTAIDKRANELLELPNNIKIALLVLVGYSNNKPEAYSYKQQDIYKIID
jgi:nitroreductase